MTIPTWAQGTYAPGAMVMHEGKLYRKDNDGDQTMPDAVAGGWTEIPLEQTNLAEFNAIATSFANYEEKVRAHKVETLAKLQAAGLNPDDVKAVLDAS